VGEQAPGFVERDPERSEKFTRQEADVKDEAAVVVKVRVRIGP